MKVLMHLSHIKIVRSLGIDWDISLVHHFLLICGFFLLFASIHEKQVCFDFHKQASSAQTGFSLSLFDFTVLPYLVVDGQTYVMKKS